MVKLLVNVSYIRIKIEQGKYLSLKEKREYLRFLLQQGVTNEQIIKEFHKYEINVPQFEFMLNDLKSGIFDKPYS